MRPYMICAQRLSRSAASAAVTGLATGPGPTQLGKDSNYVAVQSIVHTRKIPGFQ